MTNTTLDAAGRILRVGDTVGGTATQPYTSTIIGTVTGLTEQEVTVQADEPWTLPANRTFLISRLPLALADSLRNIGLHLAPNGPALFYVGAGGANEELTITWADRSAPDDDRERHVCHALILRALDILDRQEQPLSGADQGPALLYAASDRATFVRVDQQTVDDEREQSICRGLLKYAAKLASQPVPIRVDERGVVQP